MKNNYRSIILFGFLLAAFVVVLQFFEYRYFVGSLSTDVYTMIVASIFTAVGIWIGINTLQQGKKVPESSQEIDQKMIRKLNLTEREYSILGLIAQGASNQEIADQLFLAVPTVKTHTSNLYSKLHVTSRTQAIHKAQSLNLI